jgi:transglutaminase-like putative cysteine protease
VKSNQILADYDNPLVRETAEKLTSDANTVREKLNKLFHYVRDDIKFGFTQDGDLVKASTTIRLGKGQCNTKGTLLLALCKAVGIPVRIHFSLIKKEIQRGLFTGLGYKLMPPFLSHSWIEVEIDGKWQRIDSYINDEAYYQAAKSELQKRGWDTGYSVSCPGGECSSEFNIERETFVQMGAVVGDHGVWDDPVDYYASEKYRNRPSCIKLLIYRLMLGRINGKIESMRSKQTYDEC